MNKEMRSALDSLLSVLNREQLQSLLLKLAEQEPSVLATIERQARLLQTSSSQPTTPSSVASPKPSIAVDTKAIRRQVRSSIHSLDSTRSSEAYWHVGAIVGEIGQLVEQAWTLIKAVDGRQAMTVLEAITEEYMDDWENLDDSDGEASGLFHELGSAWTEAILSADLTREQREQWADRFVAWQAELDDYGVDEGFDAPQTAALDGWDYPPLKRVLQGIITEQGAWEGEPAYYADELTGARLHILERRGRFQEYLYLAEVEGHSEEYVTMLVRLGCVEEAILYGRQYLATPDEALALAKALYEHGEREQSLQIADNWLAKARRAYQILGRKEEWQAYLNELLIQHGRKYKLIPMLKTL